MKEQCTLVSEFSKLKLEGTLKGTTESRWSHLGILPGMHVICPRGKINIKYFDTDRYPSTRKSTFLTQYSHFSIKVNRTLTS